MKLPGLTSRTETSNRTDEPTAISEEQLREIVADAVRETHEEEVIEEPETSESGRRWGRTLFVLATMGAVAYWLRNRSESVGEMVSEIPDQVQRTAGETAAETEATAEVAGEQVRAGGQMASEVTEEAAERIEESGEAVGDQIEETGAEAAEQMEEGDEDEET